MLTQRLMLEFPLHRLHRGFHHLNHLTNRQSLFQVFLHHRPLQVSRTPLQTRDRSHLIQMTGEVIRWIRG